MKKTILTATLLLFAAVLGHAADITVKGTVMDGTFNEPMIGATVMPNASGVSGTATDFDGNFELTVPEGTKLTFSYIGYMSQTFTAEPEMTVTLKESPEVLDEVVVVGYTTQKKADLTGSVSVIASDDLKTTSDPDLMRSLQGKVPGMTITGTGSPSGTGTVRIRGIGSFNADQNPLYVIDGVPTTQGLNSLNANDIESMQVLKDAASASIYGSRAANGVIIITTKKGKAGDG